MCAPGGPRRSSSSRATTARAESPTTQLEEWVAAGPASAVIERIHEFIEAGCNLPILRFASPDQRGQLEQCLTDVLPAFADLRADSQAVA